MLFKTSLQSCQDSLREAAAVKYAQAAPGASATASDAQDPAPEDEEEDETGESEEAAGDDPLDSDHGDAYL